MLVLPCALAEQQVKTGREIDVQPRVIPEITKSQMAQMHGEELLALPGDVKPQSVAGKRGWSAVPAELRADSDPSGIFLAFLANSQ